MIKAKVTGWTDAKQADHFEDEHGNEWKYVVDAADATIAVQKLDGSAAGVFTWDKDAEDQGHIAVMEDGATYDVNNPGDWVNIKGCWCSADGLKRFGKIIRS